MRVIKFRFWERKGSTGKMLSWDMCKDHYQALIVGVMDEPSEDWVPLQFTGLKDKDGKEIYEGDIVRFKQLSGFACEDEYDRAKADTTDRYYTKPRVVEFNYGEFSPRQRYHEVEDGYYSWRQFDFQVIGNIYENPELLQPPVEKPMNVSVSTT